MRNEDPINESSAAQGNLSLLLFASHFKTNSDIKREKTQHNWELDQNSRHMSNVFFKACTSSNHALKQQQQQQNIPFFFS